MTGAERMRAVLRDLGDAAPAVDADVLGAFVDRVVDGVAGHAPSVDPDDPPEGPGATTGRGGGAAGLLTPSTTDTSPWVWRDEDAPDDTTPCATGSGSTWVAGARLAVKDLIAVGGRPLRCGSRTRADAPPAMVDAAVVARLRSAGAVVVGATKLHELAFGVTGINPADGTPAHPVDPSRVPGGSSSGSAVAVALGEADVALGTDTGGSVRAPASLCGVVGHKPARGAVALEGVQALSPTLDHVGWFTTGVAAARAVAVALLVPTVAPSWRAADTPPRLGVASAVVAAASEPVRTAVEAALDRLSDAGAELIEVPWPTGEEVFATTTAIMFAEAARVHRRTVRERGDLLGPDVRARLLQGAAIDIGTYLDARALRADLRRRCGETLAIVDAVLTPATPIVAPTLGEATDPAVAAVIVANTRLANATGVPALSLPIPGRLHGGALPVGLQLEAATDGLLLDAAAAVERLLD